MLSWKALTRGFLQEAAFRIPGLGLDPRGKFAQTGPPSGPLPQFLQSIELGVQDLRPTLSPLLGVLLVPLFGVVLVPLLAVVLVSMLGLARAAPCLRLLQDLHQLQLKLHDVKGPPLGSPPKPQIP